MNAQNALTEFQSFLNSNGTHFEDLTALEGVKLMTSFYETVRADNCDLDADGDMLLFQWGVYDWGEGEHFEYGMTRQLIFTDTLEEDGEQLEDDMMWQLSLTFRYPLSDANRELEADEKWCSTPNELPEFLKFIEESEATALAIQKPDSVALDFSQV